MSETSNTKYFRGGDSYMEQIAGAAIQSSFTAVMRDDVKPELNTYQWDIWKAIITDNWDDIPEGKRILYDESATCIPISTFKNCNKLETIYFANVEKIYSDAFASCTGLRYAYLPKASRMEEGAFFGCTNLKALRAENLTHLSGNGTLLSTGAWYALWEIDNGTCRSCPALRCISMPRLKRIEQGYAFRDAGLDFIYLPELTYLGSTAFSPCTNLSFAIFPKLQSVNHAVLNACSNLRDVFLGGDEVITYADDLNYTSNFTSVFGENSNKTIHVRSGLLTTYINHSQWGHYSNCFVGDYEETVDDFIATHANQSIYDSYFQV